MPPRRKDKASAVTKATTVQRRSKLAKDNDITAEEEAEIKQAWNLFRLEDVENYEDEKEGVIETRNVRQAMKAQGIGPKNAQQLREFIEILDPDSDGHVTYPHFVELCALQLNNKTDNSRSEEVEAAFKLFTKGGERPITLNDLRLVAKTLKEDVGDDVLKAMILEANGGTGVTRGVNMEDFKGIMSRAGLLQ